MLVLDMHVVHAPATFGAVAHMAGERPERPGHGSLELPMSVRYHHYGDDSNLVLARRSIGSALTHRHCVRQPRYLRRI